MKIAYSIGRTAGFLVTLLGLWRSLRKEENSVVATVAIVAAVAGALAAWDLQRQWGTEVSD